MSDFWQEEKLHCFRLTVANFQRLLIFNLANPCGLLLLQHGHVELRTIRVWDVTRPILTCFWDGEGWWDICSKGKSELWSDCSCMHITGFPVLIMACSGRHVMWYMDGVYGFSTGKENIMIFFESTQCFQNPVRVSTGFLQVTMGFLRVPEIKQFRTIYSPPKKRTKSMWHCKNTFPRW